MQHVVSMSFATEDVRRVRVCSGSDGQKMNAMNDFAAESLSDAIRISR